MYIFNNVYTLEEILISPSMGTWGARRLGGPSRGPPLLLVVVSAVSAEHHLGGEKCSNPA